MKQNASLAEGTFCGADINAPDSFQRTRTHISAAAGDKLFKRASRTDSVSPPCVSVNNCVDSHTHKWHKGASYESHGGEEKEDEGEREEGRVRLEEGGEVNNQRSF